MTEEEATQINVGLDRVYEEGVILARKVWFWRTLAISSFVGSAITGIILGVTQCT